MKVFEKTMTSFLVLHLERETEQRPPPLCCSKVLAEATRSSKQCRAGIFSKCPESKTHAAVWLFPRLMKAKGHLKVLSILT